MSSPPPFEPGAREPEPPERAQPSAAAILVCSSDGRRDILERVLPSIRQAWAGAPYPLYVGVNSALGTGPGTIPLVAPVSQWWQECATQLLQIPEERVILILDDFLFTSPIDQHCVARLLGATVELDLPYLRLVPVGRSLMRRVLGHRHVEVQTGIEQVPAGHPFFSSLQVAIWKKQHLLALLSHQRSIWEFERLRIPAVPHFAVTGPPPVAYRHVIEKGRWLPYARSQLARAGLTPDLGSRSEWPRTRYARLLLDEIRWFVLGHSTC